MWKKLARLLPQTENSKSEKLQRESINLERRALYWARWAALVASGALLFAVLIPAYGIVSGWIKTDTDAEVSGFIAGLSDKGIGASIDEINLRISSEGSKPHLLTMRGIAELEIGHFTTAAETLRQAAPSRRDAACYLGHALLHTEGVSPDVVKLAEGGLEVPDNPNELICLALAVQVSQLSGGTTDDLSPLAKEGLDAFRDSSDMQVLAAGIYLLAKDEEAAQRHANYALSLQPELALTELAAVEMLLRSTSTQSDLDEVERRILAIQERTTPNSIQHFFTMRTLASLYAKRNEPGDAERATELLHAIVDRSPVPLYRQGALIELVAAQLPGGGSPDEPLTAEQRASLDSDRLKQFSTSLVEAQFAPVMIAVGYSGLAVAALASFDSDLANEYFGRSLATIANRGDERGGLLVERSQVASPCISEDRSQCALLKPVNAQTFVGAWISKDEGAMYFVASEAEELYGALGYGDGRMIGWLREDETLAGQWCQEIDGEIISGEFELRAFSKNDEVRLDGRWRSPDLGGNNWVEAWDYERHSESPADDLELAALKVLGTGPECT